jgi:polyisoprenyl-phosphate glycosyltransferase
MAVITEHHPPSSGNVMTRPALKNALISVVLPVYNEAHVLEELHGRISRALEACGTGQEIIFVNDGSTDGTANILDAIAARDCHVRVIHFARNFGHQPAIQAGLAHARGDAVVLMDSDLQDSPEAITRLVAEWITGYDVVYAVRSERSEALWKRCLFGAFHQLLSRVAATTIPADAGNFSIIDARVVRQIVALGECDRYLPGLRSWVGYKQRGIEVRREPRYDNKPRVALRGLWRLAKTAIFSFSSFPLMLFYVIGYGALGLFLALGSYALFCKTMTDLAIPGWTSNVLVASFFGAVNALGISILGEYVIRIYDQVRQRPLYIVDETRNLHSAAEHRWPERRTTDRRGQQSVGWPGSQGADHHTGEIELDDDAYLAFGVEFDAQDELAARLLDESEEDDYADLMAEAEELLSMAAPFARGPKLLQEGGDGLLDSDEPTEPVAESRQDSERHHAEHTPELRPFHDTWALDDEWPIDEVGPVAEQQPVNGWSRNRPSFPDGLDSDPDTKPTPVHTEHHPAEHEHSTGGDTPSAAPSNSSSHPGQAEAGDHKSQSNRRSPENKSERRGRKGKKPRDE